MAVVNETDPVTKVFSDVERDVGQERKYTLHNWNARTCSTSYFLNTIHACLRSGWSIIRGVVRGATKIRDYG